MRNETRINRFATREELAGFLRELADALESGGSGELACVNEFKKIKLGIRDEFGQISLKARIKSRSRECDEQQETRHVEGKPEYKTLKKRMKSSFRILLAMIHENRMPPREAIDSFLEDSALMVTCEGYGDEYYEQYTEACEAFQKACDAGDMEKMHETIDVLIHEKSRCHAKYD
ncbi:GAK system XXXCH domain-containing protein [Pseudodesulfovibrio senegalensis]|uniref:GAK system XXXCH domain-containing protein n=1 Tax=Pseudodesulfovibrio senegalensis TaxID=1721087 RepID=A0A6N6N2L6_9BACT|nr:GAK system XXXCH domain-containing protein [Pseudodesulfovibrio senegalensis]KAB1442181.1 GAK system XXXCH domain-containing protein [Pseudodesulfovibrio senegalensis]